MKKTTILSLAMAATALTGFTSCSDDDNTSSGLTPQERKEAFESVKGQYSGKIYRLGTDAKGKTVYADSAEVKWTLNADSVMTIQQFPVSMLAEALPDSSMIKAVREAAPVDLKCYTGYVQKSPASFLINPNSIKLNLNYGGSNHSLTIGFLNNNTYSYGMGTKTRLFMQIYELAYKQDNGTAQTLKSAGVLQFVGKAQ